MNVTQNLNTNRNTHDEGKSPWLLRNLDVILKCFCFLKSLPCSCSEILLAEAAACGCVTWQERCLQVMAFFVSTSQSA